MSYAILPALESKLFCHVVVSTDSPEYAEIARKYGAEVPFLRSKELAEDVPTELVIRNAAEVCEKIYNENYWYVATLQCTTPLMQKIDIEVTCNAVLERKHVLIDSALTVKRVREYPDWQYLRDENTHILTPLMSGEILGDRGVRQNLKETYIPNGACYISERNLLLHPLNQPRIIGFHPVGIIMPENRSIDIDSEEDFWRVEDYLARNNRRD